MTIKKIYCDHCEKEINIYDDYTDTTLELCYENITVDLCTECMEELIKTAKEFCKRSGG